MSAPRLLSALDQLPRPRVLVVGDLVLDAYAWGSVDRVSPEAPVMVLEVERRESRIGGAGYVGHALRGLEAAATCIGVVGNDSEGQLLRDLMADAGIDTEGIFTDPARRTTLKERLIGRTASQHPGHILRVDSEDRSPLATRMEDQLVAHIARDITQYDSVLIADYGKGVCTPRILETAIHAARSAEVPVVVDPARSSDWTRYRGATALLINRHEAETAAGHRIVTPGEALTAGRKICQKLDLQAVIITLNHDGMAAVRRDGQGGVFPTAPRHVYEITGVGDVVLALLGVCAAGRVDWEIASPLANIAAGLVVERFGPTVISRDELKRSLQLLQRLEASGLSPDQALKVLPSAGPMSDAHIDSNTTSQRKAA